ncbi:MAG: ImpA family type VI secretion system protein, partial [Bryobacteraceae bacterium]
MPIDIEALLQPISDSRPCGADLRNHPIFIQIREARRQEENLSQGVWAYDVKEADYGLALKLSVEALTKRGKDLQVAAWLTEALLRREGFAGLWQGLSLIQRLLETYWDSVYPEIDEDGDMDLRATPLRWAGS